MRTGALWIGGVAAGTLAWIASPELQSPARLLAAALVGPAPIAFMLQAGAASAFQLPLPRIPLYAGTMAGLWALAIVSFFAGRGSDFSLSMMGFKPVGTSAFLLWTLFGILGALAIVAGFRALGFRDSDLMREIVPVTKPEKATFAALSVSAGFCEEITFRSFLVPAITMASGSLAIGIAVASLAFGAMHAHQRVGGAVRAMLLGALLTIPFVVTGSIYPSMAAHTLVDLAGGIWLARWLFT